MLDDFIFQSTLSVRRATKARALPLLTAIFQSTLSVRRATDCKRMVKEYAGISIHALREESDNCIRQTMWNCIYFNPRSP